jgi:CheY-like chemotaxis protein
LVYLLGPPTSKYPRSRPVIPTACGAAAPPETRARNRALILAKTLIKGCEVRTVEVLWIATFWRGASRSRTRRGRMAQPKSEAPEELSLRAPGRVLLVDDQPELRRLFRRTLSKAGHEVVEAWNGRAAIELARQSIFDVVISDVRMPDMSGLSLLKALYELDVDLPVVLVSGSPDLETEKEAARYGAFAFLMKPVAFEVMRENASRAITLRRVRAEAKAHFEPYASIERLRVPRGPTGERG